MSKKTSKEINPEKLLQEVETIPILTLAKKYQVNPTTIRRKLLKVGYTGRKIGRPIIKVDKNELLEGLKKRTPMELALEYNVSYLALLRFIKNNVPEYELKRGRKRKKINI